LEDSLKLSIFVARGIRRNEFIKCIYYQDEEQFPELLSLEQDDISKRLKLYDHYF
jgi:hypothetical protein